MFIYIAPPTIQWAQMTIKIHNYLNLHIQTQKFVHYLFGGAIFMKYTHSFITSCNFFGL